MSTSCSHPTAGYLSRSEGEFDYNDYESCKPNVESSEQLLEVEEFIKEVSNESIHVNEIDSSEPLQVKECNSIITSTPAPIPASSTIESSIPTSSTPELSVIASTTIASKPVSKLDSNIKKFTDSICKEMTHNNKKCKVRTEPQKSKRSSYDEFAIVMEEFGFPKDNLLLQQEWTYDYLHYHHDEGKEKVGLCLCGRKIKNVVYLLHKSSDLYFQTCLDCIKNVIPWLHQLMDIDRQREYFNKLLKTKKKSTEPSELYRTCYACHEKKIHFSIPLKKVRCKECFRKFVPVDKKYFRPCQTCDRYVILKTDPEHRVQCMNCFMEDPTPYCLHCEGTGLAFFDEENYRECSECFS